MYTVSAKLKYLKLYIEFIYDKLSHDSNYTINRIYGNPKSYIGHFKYEHKITSTHGAA